MQNQYNAFRDIYQMMSNAQNPNQLFSMLANQNPRMRPIAELLNKGANPQQVFESLCKQRGINPQEFLKQITGQ